MSNVLKIDGARGPVPPPRVPFLDPLRAKRVRATLCAVPAPEARATLATAERVRGIIASREPVLRNLQITLAYHHLGERLARLLGDENATWVCFGAWASKQAGQFIRLRGVHDRTRLVRPLVGGATELLVRTSEHVAAGNLKVFAELGPLFVDFLDRFERGPDELELERFCARLRPGRSEVGGQGALREAFTALHDAIDERRPKVKAELVLEANLRIGLHEQIRLQPAILASVDAGYDAVAARLRRSIDLLPLPELADDVVGIAGAGFRAAWRRAAAEWLMRLPFSDVELRLGDDVPGAFSPDLLTIESRAVRAILAEWDPTPDSTKESGARDWVDLRERMHFIADMMRCRQQCPALLDAPFGPAQQREILADRIPDGPL